MSTTDAARLAARDESVIAGVQRLRFFPLVAETGRGSVLVEPGGRELIDLSASWTASGFGHGEASIAAAIAHAAIAPPGSSVLSGSHPDAVALAEELLDLIPSRLGAADRRVYLGHAGTDANDVAIRGCRAATGRPRILAFENGYHGGLGTAQRVSGVHVSAGVAADAAVTFLPYPDPHRPHTGDPSTVLGDVLDRADRELARGETAAVIVEPLQSDGGLIVPPKGFLAGLRALCDRHGTLLTVDEVKVGLGRTGRTHAFEHDEVVPDVVTLGKALGGGLPLSATIGPADVLDHPVASALMTTTGNPISCAAGRAVLRIVREGAATTNAAQRGAQLAGLLSDYARSRRPGAGLIDDVRGRGLSVGVELVSGDRADSDALTAKTVYRAWQLGVIAYPVRGNVIELTPPLTISADSIERAVAILTTAIDDAAQGVVSDHEIAPYQGW
ncbi:aminotransferase class III-fold pyridoxal phosphate-dependent enzyme [Microbacterium esteraromaticum]|uniref:aspartate aminotransferase family protein n=1 Tax=Microbacterium esteraromaticum TaxID=57043 RepID=UPI0023677595|nr:aminotransferase class III-fold pyridoxal phosphate-dependent enzyme [Microbacterium esteraromaticum]WDH78489.1 aminotransferase class III-fold pyridoxal phosphate-dependent enzyme [Microbacterium esteraromaticum]